MLLTTRFAKILLTGFFLGVTLLLYHSLGRDYLFDWDESIYAQLGREQGRGQFLTPTYNQELWLEKPPLIAHLTALGQTLAPSDLELGSRLFIPLATLITLLSVSLIGSSLGGSATAILAPVLLMTFDLFVGRSRSLNTDILLIAGITLSVALILRKAKPPWVALALALAIFAKGPAGILAILITLPLFFAQDKKYFFHSLGYLLLYTLPWHLYQLLRHGASFYTPYLLEQVVRRATVPIEFHLESRWFYFVHLYQDLGLGVLLPAALGLGLLIFQKKYLIAWWVFLPLALFTLAKTRLSWYILPIYPALALALGYLFATLLKKIPRRASALAPLLLIAIATQSLLHLVKATEPTRASTPLPSHIKIAQTLAQYPGSELAFLVSPSERTAEAILPQTQRLSSSFRYGGAPSVVLYSQKRVTYYYNYEAFSEALRHNRFELVLLTAPDLQKLPPGYQLIAQEGEYLGYQSERSYAHR